MVSNKLKSEKTYFAKNGKNLFADPQCWEAAVGHRSQPLGENVQNVVLDEGHLQIVFAQLGNGEGQQGDFLRRRLLISIAFAVFLHNKNEIFLKNLILRSRFEFKRSKFRFQTLKLVNNLRFKTITLVLRSNSSKLNFKKRNK